MSKPPHNQRGQQQQRVLAVQQTTTTQWSGPLPSPADLERFDKVIPQGAERILKMAELEQGHRHEYEKEGMVASTKEAGRGQFLGALVSCLAIGAAAYTASIHAHWAVSTALVGIPVLGLVRAIVRPRAPKPPPAQS